MKFTMALNPVKKTKIMVKKSSLTNENIRTIIVIPIIQLQIR